jgi:cytidylate kinase
MHLTESPFYSSVEFRTFVEDAIRAFAAEGSVVIAGHGAQLVLSDHPNTLRVMVTGSERMRARRAASSGMAMDDALASVRKADEERVAYFHEFYKQGWLDPSTYDLMVNTDMLSPDAAAGLIVSVATSAAQRCSSVSVSPTPLPPRSRADAIDRMMPPVTPGGIAIGER